VFYGLLVALHLVVSIFLILVVLLQTGKGADLAGAFGGGGSQTAFGSRGATTLLSKLTTASAILFMLTSFTLAILSARGSSSVLDEAGVPTPTPPVTAPAAAPAADPAAGEPEAAIPGEEMPAAEGVDRGVPASESEPQEAEGASPEPAESAPEPPPE
jgi:preprotein translocase subunit SecG